MRSVAQELKINLDLDLNASGSRIFGFGIDLNVSACRCHWRRGNHHLTLHEDQSTRTHWNFPWEEDATLCPAIAIRLQKLLKLAAVSSEYKISCSRVVGGGSLFTICLWSRYLRKEGFRAAPTLHIMKNFTLLERPSGRYLYIFRSFDRFVLRLLQSPSCKGVCGILDPQSRG